MTETTYVSLNTTLLAGSGIQEKNGVLQQKFSSSDLLDEGDTGGDNLAKGGGLWD